LCQTAQGNQGKYGWHNFIAISPIFLPTNLAIVNEPSRGIYFIEIIENSVKYDLYAVVALVKFFGKQ
jgi:hypothetical protein